jgi:hypothetical protein
MRFIVGFTPGGSFDITARLISQWLSEHLGHRPEPGARGLMFLHTRSMTDRDGTDTREIARLVRRPRITFARRPRRLVSFSLNNGAMSALGTELPTRNVRSSVAIGGKA